MKAIVRTHYGLPEALELQEVATPRPKDDEVLVKVVAVSLNRSDWEGMLGEPLYARIGGLFRPRHQILGSDIAGRVEAVGKNVTRFHPGDEVFGDILLQMGGFAEYVCARETYLALKPAGVTFEQASTLPQAGVIALQGMRDKGQVRPGQHVAVNGAGGGGGMFAVQLAKLYGAEVTAVDSGAKREFLHSLGADRFVDFTREDFTKSGTQYDVILDLIAYRSVFDCARALKRGGRYYAVGGPILPLLRLALLGPLVGAVTGKKIRVLAVQPNLEDMLHVAELCEAGKLVPAIDRRVPLSEVPQALRALGDGQTRGKAVIAVEKR